jgi:hypothetical protein
MAAPLFDDAGIFSAPAFPLRGGPGPHPRRRNCFAGGFMGALAASGDLTPDALRRAVIHGSVMASFASSASASTRFALIGAETDARFAQFRALTRFSPLRSGSGFNNPARIRLQRSSGGVMSAR